MKKIIMAALFLAGTASSAVAAGPYIGGATGVSIFHESDLDNGYNDTISYDPGPAVNVSCGYNFGGMRLEGEYGYKHADVYDVSGYRATGDTAIHSVMANFLYDFTPTRVATPVVGVGFGALFGVFDDGFRSYDDTKPGYQVTVGAAFKLGKTVNLDVAYRLQGAFADFDVADSKVSYMSSNLLVGARYNF
jgi:opacity protein-like surface antigen